MFQIICNIKGSRAMLVSETQLQTIGRYNLLSDLLDSNGIVSEEVSRYFAGACSAEECAEMIQNRVSIMLSEQS